jgi:hypothetical protein
MSQDRSIPAGMAEWVLRSLDGTITAEEFAKLDQEIATNGAARRYYIEFITTYVGLADLVGVLPEPVELVGKPATRGCVSPGALVAVPSSETDEEKIRRIERYARQQLDAFLEQQHQGVRSQPARSGWGIFDLLGRFGESLRWLLGLGIRTAKIGAICSLLAIGVLIVGLCIYANRPLGTLVESTEAKWSVPVEPGAELKSGRLTLEQGYARIAFKKGAEVIIQAPSTFNLQTSNKLSLESGWITAKVPPSAVGFMVQTPASSVVDFGTEFGLLAGGENTSELHVFAGRVGLTSGRNAAMGAQYEQLKEGQTATVDALGQVVRAVLDNRPRLFVRTMPTGGGFGIAGKRLSLADMVGGGNGLDTGVLGRGIDAGTGQITTGYKILLSPDKGFTAVPSLPFVDGVFVPDSSDGSAIVTSTGIDFKECPKTSGKGYQAITYGATFVAIGQGVVPGRLAGKTYDSQVNPSVGMHPNVGITFDLDAIRSAMPEVEIDRFRAACGVSETAIRFAATAQDPNAAKVAFWVLIDGQVRFSRELKPIPAQSEQIDVVLRPSDRFLTLATTHPGNYGYCWSLFAEPALELTTRKPAARTSGN